MPMLKYQRWAQAAGLSPGTIRLRKHYLALLKRRFPSTPLLHMTRENLTAFMATPGWSPETRKSVRTTLRSFYSWAYDNDIIEHDPSRKLPTVRVPQGKPRPTPEDVFLQALLLADQRGRLMLMLAGYAGLRVSEIAQVHTDHIGADELRVKGKGGKVRTVPLHPVIVKELAQVDHVGYLFPGQDDGHISAGHVGVLMRRMLGKGWSGHTLRHRFASMAYAVERDLLAVQNLLGHSKPETTQRYTAIPDGARRSAVFGIQ